MHVYIGEIYKLYACCVMVMKLHFCINEADNTSDYLDCICIKLTLTLKSRYQQITNYKLTDTKACTLEGGYFSFQHLPELFIHNNHSFETIYDFV